MDKNELKKMVIEKLDAIDATKKMLPIHFEILEEQVEQAIEKQEQYKNIDIDDSKLPDLVLWNLALGMTAFEGFSTNLSRLSKSSLVIHYRNKEFRV